MSAPSSRQVTGGRLLWLAVFSVAMGLLEAIVVAYLRELYFPEGFRFPLRFIPEQMLHREVLRELSTLVMLLALSLVAARGSIVRFSVFLFTFGVWDLSYYLFLKLLLDWPQSLLTWDVLFLIPVTWVGPVLAPVICALTMIGLAMLVLSIHRRPGTVLIGTWAWLMMAAGAGLIFFTFISAAADIIIRGGFLSDLGHLAANRDFQAVMGSFVPERFDWWLFTAGEAMVLLSTVIVYRTNKASAG